MDFENIKETFVIAEAGSNWKCGTFEEDLEQAKALITCAASAGANAVKFQTFKTESTYVENAGSSNYLSKEGYSENINEIFEKLSMPNEMIPELAHFCEEKNIMFMSTPFSIEDAKQIEPYVKIHKVASFENNHSRLLEYLADTGKPMLVSTGASDYNDIRFAVELIKKKHKKVVLMQCTSKYPCPLNALNLQTINTMKKKFSFPTGLSDHSVEPIIAPLMAIGLGAVVIEKHFTLDKTLSGPDHSFALNPTELTLMIDLIRKADSTKGSGEKQILEIETELRTFAKRTIQAIQNISKGDILQEGKNIEVLRPGNRLRGLDAKYLGEIIGKKAATEVKKGDGITRVE